MTGRKRGRLSIKEMRFIEKQIQTLGAEKVSEKLNRDIDKVIKFALSRGIAVDGETPENVVVEAVIASNLEKSPEWTILKDQFALDERKFFAHRYARIVGQFKDDLLPTEEAQVFQWIKFEILMNRNLSDTEKSRKDIENLQGVLTKMYFEVESLQSSGKPVPDATRNTISNLQNELTSLRSATSTKTMEYIKLQEKVSSITKEMRATREQRILRVEGAKQSWTDLLKSLDDSDVRAREGRQMELVKLAMKKEIERLGENHVYIDGSIDKPLLSAETVE